MLRTLICGASLDERVRPAVRADSALGVCGCRVCL